MRRLERMRVLPRISALQFDQNLVIAVVVDIPGGVGIAPLAEVDLTGVQRQSGNAAGARHLEGCALDGVEKIVMVMAMGFNALSGLQRELSHANALVLENQLGSDFGHVDLPGKTTGWSRRDDAIAALRAMLAASVVTDFPLQRSQPPGAGHHRCATTLRPASHNRPEDSLP